MPHRLDAKGRLTTVAFVLPVLQSEPEVESLDVRDGSRWRRTGHCCRCGQCCEGDPFSGEEGTPAVAGMCPVFRWETAPTADSPGIGACSNREHRYYLGGCNAWPSLPEHIEDKPLCTFRFQRIA
jgi:hypothetical protein